MTFDQILLHMLKTLQSQGPVHPHHAICESIIDLRYTEEVTAMITAAGIHRCPSECFLDRLQSLWVNWPKFSGIRVLPVPAPAVEGKEPSHKDHYAVYHYHSVHDRWSGPYGDNRKELLAWLIEQLTVAVSQKNS